MMDGAAATDTDTFTVCWSVMVAADVVTVTEAVARGAASPVPLSLMTCGESIALSLMLMEPVRKPVAVGLKTIANWHAAL